MCLSAENFRNQFSLHYLVNNETDLSVGCLVLVELARATPLIGLYQCHLLIVSWGAEYITDWSYSTLHEKKIFFPLHLDDLFLFYPLHMLIQAEWAESTMSLK